MSIPLVPKMAEFLGNTVRTSEWIKCGGHWFPDHEHAQYIEHRDGFTCKLCRAKDKELWACYRYHDWGIDDMREDALLCEKCFVGDALTYEI